MVKTFLFLTAFLLVGILGEGQINRKEADSMILSLKKSKSSIYRIDLLLHLAQFHIFKPGEKETDFDSAIVYIKEAKALNQSVKSSTSYGFQLLTESLLTKERGNKEEGKQLAEQAVSILETGNNKNYQGQAYYELSTYYDYTDSLQYIQRVTLVEKAVSAFEESGNLKNKGMALEMLGDLYSENDSNTEAIPALKRALAVYDSINYPHLQGIYITLGACYAGKQEYGQALFYDLKALKTAQVVKDTSMQLCRIYNQLAVLYQDIGKLDVALDYFHKALQIAQANKDDNAVFLLATNISSVYHTTNQPELSIRSLALIPGKYLVTEGHYNKFVLNLCFLRDYIQLEQFSKAKPYFDTVLALADKKLVSGHRRCNGYRSIARYYLATKHYAEARHYLEKSMTIVASLDFEYGRIQGFRLTYELDSAEGNFKSAYKYLSMYKAKTDSISSERTAGQFQVLHVEYEVGMKEDSIKLKDQNILLLTQRNSLQQATLKQQSLIKNITVSGIIVAFVIIALLYRQYKQKKKTNKVITKKNEQLEHYLAEKEWLVKEIHHRVKNNLQTVVSLLGTQAGYLKNEEAISAIADSQHRIQSMSLIHQRLYQSGDISSIKMPDYIHELVDYLEDSYNNNNRIHFNLEIEPIELDLAHCIPLGLILNEAITNSFKYAFPGDREGEIRIVLKRNYENDFLLTIQDNGTGLPAGFDIGKSDSMGMNLMRGLSAEIGAKFILYDIDGTCIAISFVYERSSSPHGLQAITETPPLA